MHTKLFARSRIRLIRPLRPPNSRIRLERQRLFTQNAQRLLLAPRNGRPQLSYLGQPTFRQKQTPVARLLSTENRRYFTQQAWAATKWTAIIWTFIALGAITWIGIQLESAERKQPTPEEWSFKTRQGLRAARAAFEEGAQTGVVNWPFIGSQLRMAIGRLEDAGIDGKDIKQMIGDLPFTSNVETRSYDVSSKSWPWRAAYFETVMKCATAAEHLDSMVLDRIRNMAFPREYMIGPSNPNPRPVPSYMAAAPLEQNCDQHAFDQPDVYYAKILSGEGFTTDQKLDAAFAYANWLEFKGAAAASEELYREALNIAKAGMPGNADAVVDDRSYVLLPDTEGPVTANLLRATTNFAIHQARTGNISAALPELLSVFRARRNAPVAPAAAGNTDDENRVPPEGIAKVLNVLKKVFRAPKFPGPPRSGDHPFRRLSEKPTCEDGELMLYIGEILFATSKHPDEGIAWTRQAVTVAEANLQPAAGSNGSDSPDTDKCRECLLTGVRNWEVMLQRLAEKAGEAAAREGSTLVGPGAKRGWFGTIRHVEGQGTKDSHADLLGEELRQVERFKQRIMREGIDREMFSDRSTRSGR